MSNYLTFTVIFGRVKKKNMRLLLSNLYLSININISWISLVLLGTQYSMLLKNENSAHNTFFFLSKSDSVKTVFDVTVVLPHLRWGWTKPSISFLCHWDSYERRWWYVFCLNILPWALWIPATVCSWMFLAVMSCRVCGPVWVRLFRL